MSEEGTPGGCSRRTANVGLGVAIIGALLVFVVPGGLWSDVPGYAMLVLGAFTEVVFTVSNLVARARARP